MKSVNFTNLTLNIKHLNLNYEKRDSVILKSEFPLKNIPRFLHVFEKLLSSEKCTGIQEKQKKTSFL